MSFQKHLLAACLSIAAGLFSIAPTFAQSPGDARLTNYVKECVPALEAAENERISVVVRHYNAMVTDIQSAQITDAVEGFADSVLSLRSKSQRVAAEFTKSDEHRQWILAQFRSKVLQLPSIRKLVATQVDAMNTELRDVDHRLLVELNHGDEIDEVSAEVDWLSPDVVNRQIDALSSQISGSVIKAVDTSLTNSALAIGSGLAAGLIADTAYGADGEYSWWDMARSWAISAGTDYAVQKIADANTTPKKTLMREIFEIRNRFSADLLTPRGDGQKLLITACIETLAEHNDHIVRSVGEQHGLHPEVALYTYGVVRGDGQ